MGSFKTFSTILAASLALSFLCQAQAVVVRPLLSIKPCLRTFAMVGYIPVTDQTFE